MEAEVKLSVRLDDIDIAKALGMLLVLINHLDLILGPVTFLGGMFYMPVFFMTAGMTYRFKKRETPLLFAVRKFKRLVFPYFIYNLFLFLFFFLKDSIFTGTVGRQSFFPLLGILYSRNALYRTDNGEQLQLMTNLNAPTWFLTGLFITITGYHILRYFFGDKRKGMGTAVLVCFLSSVLIQRFCPVLLPWSLETSLFCMVFLLAGEWIREYNCLYKLRHRPAWIWAAAILFLLSAYLNGSGNLSVNDYGTSMLLYMTAGVSGSVLCLVFSGFLGRHTKVISKVLILIGQNTMGILCLHLFLFMIVKGGLFALGFPQAESGLMKLFVVIVTVLILVPVNQLLHKKIPWL